MSFDGGGPDPAGRDGRVTLRPPRGNKKEILEGDGKSAH